MAETEVPGVSQEAPKVQAPTFIQVQAELAKPNLEKDRKDFLLGERDKILDDIIHLDRGRYLHEVRTGLLSTLKNTDWDDIYVTILNKGKDLNRDLMTSRGHDPRWEGVMEEAMRPVAARVALGGIARRVRENLPVTEDWAERHGYSEESTKLLKEDARDKLFDRFQLLPAAPEDLVGKSIPRFPDYEAARGGAGGLSEEEYRRQSLEFQRENVHYQREQLELMRKGYKGFIQGERRRAYVDPKEYYRSLPPWFEELSEQEQLQLETRLNINFLAAVKAQNGMKTFEEWAEAPISIDSPGLQSMWKDMPGYRLALATMSLDFFIEGANHLIISGTPDDKSPTEGYANMGSQVRLNHYKENLIERLSAYLSENGGRELEKRFRVSTRELAVAAVSAVDNLFFAGGAYDSGDEKRKLSAGDKNLYSESVRTLLMPGIKGKEGKWLKERGKKQGVSEEDFGGKLGEWIRENAALNREGFRVKLEKGEVRLIPDRLIYSLFDHTYIEGTNKPDGSKTSLAQALTSLPKREVSNGLYDFEEGEGAIDFNKLDSYDILGNYADLRSGAIGIFRHLTGGDPTKDRMTEDKFINALIKERKDPQLNAIYMDEDLVVAGIALVASPEKGLVRGTPEIVLNIPEEIYDNTVYGATTDSRLFEGMRTRFRERLLARLHARDLTAPSTLFSELLPGISSSSVFSERERIRRRAAENLKRGR